MRRSVPGKQGRVVDIVAVLGRVPRRIEGKSRLLRLEQFSANPFQERFSFCVTRLLGGFRGHLAELHALVDHPPNFKVPTAAYACIDCVQRKVSA